MPVEGGSSSEPTLEELAQKLSELRQHLRQVLRGLNIATSPARVGDFSTGQKGFRCHACARARSADQQGWTLRLCGDDELHPFCPDCDGRHVDRDGRDVLQGIHPLPDLRDEAGWLPMPTYRS